MGVQEPVRAQVPLVPLAGMQAPGGTLRWGHTHVHTAVGLVGLLVLGMEMASHSWFTAGKGIIYVCAS